MSSRPRTRAAAAAAAAGTTTSTMTETTTPTPTKAAPAAKIKPQATSQKKGRTRKASKAQPQPQPNDEPEETQAHGQAQVPETQPPLVVNETKDEVMDVETHDAVPANLQEQSQVLPELNMETQATPTLDDHEKQGDVKCGTCDKGDDGSPMVLCEGCEVWYHFSCVGLTADMASEIQMYICPSCTEQSGLRTVSKYRVQWEGPDAFEPVEPAAPPVAKKTSKKGGTKAKVGTMLKKSKSPDVKMAMTMPPDDEESSDDDDSADEYVDGRTAKSKEKRLRLKGRVVQSGDSSESSSEGSDSDGPKNPGNRSGHNRPRSSTTAKSRSTTKGGESGKPSSSPAPSSQGHPHGRETAPHPSGAAVTGTKRKSVSAHKDREKEHHQPPTKKRRGGSTESSPEIEEDPARKYCLGKLEALFKDIFLKYPHVWITGVEEKKTDSHDHEVKDTEQEEPKKGEGGGGSDVPMEEANRTSMTEGIGVGGEGDGGGGEAQADTDMKSAGDKPEASTAVAETPAMAPPPSATDTEHHEEEPGVPRFVEKKPEELTDEQRSQIVEESKHFAVEVERCIYGTYAEHDKQGSLHAGGKYKDRFRMLQFNLSKPDRVVIHRRIASNNITPAELSMMSSTDLANEETKESIKILEKESLEYSILKKSVAPRAKLTHKGIQELEDVNADVARERSNQYDAERQREREQEEEERRERERTARLKTVSAAASMTNRQRTMSTSLPPESPSIPSASWGGPPPLPSHMGGDVGSSDMVGVERLPPHPIFDHTTSDFMMPEPELNLADLINIDDEPLGDSSAAVPTTEQQSSSSIPEAPATPIAAPITDQSNVTLRLTDKKPSELSISTTPLSPFASRSEGQKSSFDLNALWSASPTANASTKSITVEGVDDAMVESPVSETSPGAGPGLSGTSVPEHRSPLVQATEQDIVLDGGEAGVGLSTSADDQDFDMFLDERPELAKAAEIAGDNPSSKLDQQDTFDALPMVWSGKILMPLDSASLIEAPVVARQMAGRPMAHDSVLWKTLFPSDALRVDGRVPVGESNKFLLQVRMNTSKELVAVALSPTGEQDQVNFKAFSDFLIAKGRHGLIFPWGSRPKEPHPGRELYLVPLLSSEPLPEFMEILDDLKLPKERRHNYLVGIWVLNRGKLVPPSSISPPQPPPLPHVLPHMQGNIPGVPSSTHSPMQHGLPFNLASLALGQQNIAPGGALQPGVPPVPPAALAAEVASLTPEQIQVMIKTLTQQQQASLPASLAPTAPAQPTGMHPHQPPPVPWPGVLPQPHGYPGMYATPPPHPGGPPPPLPPPGAPASTYERRDEFNHAHVGYPPREPRHGGPTPPTGPSGFYSHDRRDSYDEHDLRDWDGRGQGPWRGSGRGRGRGRGGGGSGGGRGGYGDGGRRPVDQGWPRRQKGDGRGGNGMGSPNSKRW